MIIVNTIGYTGAEILASKLSELSSVKFLPGQNFANDRGRFYRKHDFSGCDASAIFDILYQHQFTKSGKAWLGLSKHFNTAQKSDYDFNHHKNIFIKEYPLNSSLIDSTLR